MFLGSLVKLNSSIQSGILEFCPQIQVQAKKKSLCRILVQISCCQVGTTSQNTKRARHILPPSVSDIRGHLRLASPKSTPVQNQVI